MRAILRMQGENSIATVGTHIAETLKGARALDFRLVSIKWKIQSNKLIVILLDWNSFHRTFDCVNEIFALINR